MPVIAASVAACPRSPLHAAESPLGACYQADMDRRSNTTMSLLAHDSEWDSRLPPFTHVVVKHLFFSLFFVCLALPKLPIPPLRISPPSDTAL